MFELMNDKAIEAGAERRREVAIETMRAARADVARLRFAARIVVVSVRRIGAMTLRRRAPAAHLADRRRAA